MAFANGAKDKSVPISFAVYLIKTQNRNILIDAGCDTMPGFVMENFHSPAKVLEDIGVFAEDITDVIITHAHHDHIEALKHFVNATVHITKEQYDRGKGYIPTDFSVNIIKESYCLTEHIKIIKWGGHDVGSAVVEVNFGGNTHIFAGDECYTEENITKKICTGTSVCYEKSAEFVNMFSNSKYVVHTCHDSSLNTERII